MPKGRWNTPDEAAGVVAMLLGADAAPITGRVIDAEAGFRRWPLMAEVPNRADDTPRSRRRIRIECAGTPDSVC
jgi:hypothetical protein